MAAGITRLRTKADRLRQAENQHLRQLVLDFAAGRRISERAVGEIIATIDRETSSAAGWTFVMVNPEVNAAIVNWLIQNSTRPLVAVRLWAELFPHIRNDTCEIVRTRAEIAEALGVAPRHVSEIMTELESVGAISRQHGPSVRYFMNPVVGTHLTGRLRPKAQAAAPKLDFRPKPKRTRKPKLALVPAAE